MAFVYDGRSQNTDVSGRMLSVEGRTAAQETHTSGAVNARSYGARGDNSTDCTPALLAAYADVGPTGTVRFPKVASESGVYYFSAFIPQQLTGLTIDADPDVVLSTNFDDNLSTDVGFRYVRPTRFYWRGLARYYTTTATASLKGANPAPVKDLWVSDSELNRSQLLAILPNAGGVEAAKIVWNGSDTWEADSFTSTTAKAFTYAPGAATNYWHMGMRDVTAGDELSASFSLNAGTPYLAAFVKTTAGYRGLFCESSGSSPNINYAEKNTGTSGTSSTITPVWRGNHSSYYPINSVWQIRIDAPTNASILFNGTIVTSFSTPGPILQAGFGMFANGASDSVTVQDLVVTTQKPPSYGAYVSVRVFGDSRSAPRYDAWPDHLKTALEFTAGIRATVIDNQAIPGKKSADQWATMQSVGVSDVDVVVIDIGTNDVQGFVGASTFLSNLTDMVSYCQTRNKLVVLVVPDLWYTQGQSGGTGQGSANYDGGALYRSAIFRLAAETGAKLVDSPQVSGPVLANYVNDTLTPDLTSAGDPYLSDNIHPTSLANRIRAREVAKAIAGALIPYEPNRVQIDALADHTSGWVNVKSYGALGDGSHDDTAAIQAAIDVIHKLSDDTGRQGRLYLPKGVYGTSAPLRFGKNIEFVGEGVGFASVIKPLANFSGDAVILIDGDLAIGGYAFRQTHRGYTIDESAVTKTIAPIAVKINKAYSIRFEGVWIYEGVGTGWDIYDCNDTVLDHVRAYGDQNDSAHAAFGIRARGTTGGGIVDGVTIISPDIEVYNVGISQEGNAQVTLVAPYMEQNITGWKAQGNSGGFFTVTGGKVESPGASGVAANASGQNVTVLGGRYTANGGLGLYVDAGAVNVRLVNPAGNITNDLGASNTDLVTASGALAAWDAAHGDSGSHWYPTRVLNYNGTVADNSATTLYTITVPWVAASNAACELTLMARDASGYSMWTGRYRFDVANVDNTVRVSSVTEYGKASTNGSGNYTLTVTVDAVVSGGTVLVQVTTDTGGALGAGTTSRVSTQLELIQSVSGSMTVVAN